MIAVLTVDSYFVAGELAGDKDSPVDINKQKSKHTCSHECRSLEVHLLNGDVGRGLMAEKRSIAPELLAREHHYEKCLQKVFDQLRILYSVVNSALSKPDEGSNHQEDEILRLESCLKSRTHAPKLGLKRTVFEL